MRKNNQKILVLAQISKFGGNAPKVTNGLLRFITEHTVLVVPYAIMRDAQKR